MVSNQDLLRGKGLPGSTHQPLHASVLKVPSAGTYQQGATNKAHLWFTFPSRGVFRGRDCASHLWLMLQQCKAWWEGKDWLTLDNQIADKKAPRFPLFLVTLTCERIWL